MTSDKISGEEKGKGEGREGCCGRFYVYSLTTVDQSDNKRSNESLIFCMSVSAAETTAMGKLQLTTG